jgi:hypothetical protein
MKYICTRQEDGREEVFTFPDSVNHDTMAEVLGCIKNQTQDPWHRVMREPVSAGFVGQNGTCYGESITLGLRSREIDSILLDLQF